MKIISVDAGAFSSQSNTHYGNFTFSKELIRFLQQIDRVNNYRFYLQKTDSFFQDSKGVVIKPKIGWLKLGISLREIISPSEVFLALNQALPWYCPGKKIVFCHGLAPLNFPKLYPDSQKRMKQQIRQMLQPSNWIVTGSQRLKNSLNDIYREEKRSKKPLNIKVLNYGIGQNFLNYKAAKRQPVILYVGSSHPIKNLNFLMTAFLQFINLPKFRHFKLQLVGVGNNFKPLPTLSPKVKIINYCQNRQLIRLYRQVSCLISTSLEESFNLPILEALSQKTPVVATKSATIPELEPYISLAANSPLEFAKTIAQAITRPKAINLTQLRKQFDWQYYVQELIKLYD